MSAVSAEDVRLFLSDYLTQKAEATGMGPVGDIDDDCDLLLSGMIDSLGLLELVTTVQETYGEHIDFEELDPEQLTVVGPLCRFISERAGQA